MTADELREKLIRLHETMTPGEWGATSLDGNSDPDVEPGLTEGKRYWYVDAGKWQVCQIPAWFITASDPNAIGIAELRNLLPELIAALDALLAEAKRQAESIIGMTCGEGIDAERFQSVPEMSVAMAMRSKRDEEKNHHATGCP